MSDSIRVRRFQPNRDDYAAVARVAAQFPPDVLGDYEYASPADLRAFDASFDGTVHALERYVAEHDGAVVGYGLLFHIPWLRETGRFWSAIRVDPAHQRRGAGRQLYGRLLVELRRLRAAATWLEVHESAPALTAHAERRGFRELFRSWGFALDTRGFDLARFQHAAERAAERGIVITTLERERERGPAWLPRLYELHAAITRDIPLPGHPHPAPGLDWFERYVCGSPLALPEAFFVARHGDRYVGESFLHRVEQSPGDLSQKVTGIHADYRGYGIAVALKLATIAYAQRHGYSRIWTGVESNNPSMLAINARLGFVQMPGLIVFEKELRSEDTP
jgi:GNAT superfamily N-acetyltransferase